MRPWPKGSPLRNTVGTAITLRRVDFVLEQRAVDRDVRDARVEHRHQVQRLHHVGAVLAGQREIGLEAEVAVESRTCSISSCAAFGGWPPTCSSASTSEVNSWPIGRPAKRTPISVPARRITKLRRARIVAGGCDGDLVGQRGDLVQQLAHLARLGVVAQAGDQLDRLADVDRDRPSAAASDWRRAWRALREVCVVETAARGGGSRPGPRSPADGEAA